MSVKFRSHLELSAHRAIAHSDAAQTLTVTVATKTAAHPEYGNGSSNGYVIDGVEGAYLEFTPGNTYKFDQSDNSNTGHPLRFYQDAAKTTAYTTGVTTNGTPGNSGAYTQIIPSASTPPILYYQCSAHALMGSYTKFGTGSQGDTYTLSATQDGDNVDILLDAGSGTDSTVQLTAGNNITLTRSSAQEVEIASSGGGGGSVTVEKNVYTANGSTTTFNTSTAIVNENNVQVYIDGVYQSKDNYTTNGSTVTFSTAPPNTTSVELIHMVAVDGVIARDGFTGNGSTTAFVLSMSITNENATQVYIDGVYQSKNNYTTSGSTLTFSTAPPSGAAVEVVHIKAVDASSLNQNSFTGNGSTTAFTLSQSIDDENKTFVFIQGVYQEKSMYSISGNTITFSTAPQNGYTVEVMAFSAISLAPAVSITGGTGISVVTNSPNNFTVSNTLVDVTVSWATPSGQSLTYTNPSPQSSIGQAGSIFPTTTFTITKAANTLSGTAVLTGLPTGVTIASQSYNNNNAGNVLTITLEGVYPSANALNTGIIVSGLTATVVPPIVDYLVVAGGGGGGSYIAGGGGAGGLRTSYGSASGGGSSAESALTLALGNSYTVTVGGGGNKGISGTGSANGNNSVFSNITSIGGGGGGAAANPAGSGGTYSGQSGANGGSGGGTAYHYTDSTGVLFGSGTANQGYNGGNGHIGGASFGGGGGGAGGVGSSSGSGGGGTNGGAGLSVSITGSSVTYAAGGRGGGNTNPGGRPNAASNTGNGGDGSYQGNGAGNGGSGVVIIRYSNAYTVTIGSGLTGSTATDGSDKVTTFTAGTGTITFS
jgi:hypothetical protein